MSLSDALSHWKVQNLALRVDANKLTELPTPFIAQVRTPYAEEFYLISKVEFGEVECKIHSHKNRITKIHLEKFLTIWTGNVLLAEASEESGEKKYGIHLRNQRRSRRDQMKKITGGISATVSCRKGFQKTIGGLRITRWSCNNQEGDFYSYSRLEDGDWIEKRRLNLNGWEW